MEDYLQKVTHNATYLDLKGDFICVYCLHKCTSEQITKIVDNGSTLVCPFCRIDSLMHSSQYETLDDIRKYHFYAFSTNS